MAKFDYIIVGAGSAGCVLADRLTRDPVNRVLLVEAGPKDDHPLIGMPMGVVEILKDTGRNWYYATEPDASEEGAQGRSYLWLRGKMLGGSSSVNGMLYFRGQPQDYDTWQAQGCEGWGWDQMSRCFRELEDHDLGDDGVRGVGGPLHVSIQRNPTPLTEAIIAAGERLGLKRREDLNGLDQEGIGYSPRTIRNGRRVSAADAFLKPAMRRPNLTVVTDTLVERVLFEGRRAVGVKTSCAGQPGEYRASREVIICAGALQSPVLLQLSGIGPAEHLRAVGIEPLHDSPDTGGNLREHKVISINLRLAKAFSHNHQLRGPRLWWNVARYFLTRTGPLAQTYDINAFVRTRMELDRPDAQLTFWALSMVKGSPTIELERHPGLMFMGYPLRTESQGSVMVRSSNPADPPLIKANFLTSEYDRRAIVDLFRYVRTLLEQAPLKALIAEETSPGPAVQSDEEILAACLRDETCFHAVGTCRMGADDNSVVDPRLRVRGVEGLRVMDCSVMPTQVSGNTNGPVIAMAWRAAELILQDRRA